MCDEPIEDTPNIEAVPNMEDIPEASYEELITDDVTEMNEVNYALRSYRWRDFYALYDLLYDYDWQWIATLTLDDDLSPEIIDRKLLRWIRSLQKTEHIRVGYARLICTKRGHPHVHLLMIGRGNRSGETVTLRSINPRIWSDRWPCFAKIRPVGDKDGAIRYMALHTFKSRCDDWDIDFYNIDLLRRSRRRINLIVDFELDSDGGTKIT